MPASLAKIAFLSLKRKKLRTILLIVSVAIATSILTGVNAAVDTLEQTYINLVTTNLGYTDLVIMSNSTATTGALINLTSIESHLSDGVVASYSGRVQCWVPFVSKNESFKSPYWLSIAGANPELDEKFGEYEVLEGSISSIAEGVSREENSCVVTESVATQMDIKVGEGIYIGGWNLTKPMPAEPENLCQLKVVGVIRDYGRVYFFNPENPDENFMRSPRVVFADLPTVQNLFNVPASNVTHVYVHVSDITKVGSAKTSLQKALALSYSISNLKARMLGSIEQSVSNYRTLISLVAGMSMLVAAMLLLNSMFMAISERKYEIGILRSIGASRGQIFYVFLLEILLMGIVGALLGVPLAIATAKTIIMVLPMPYIAYVGQPEGAMEFVFSTRTILIGILVGVVSTLIAGLIPSLSAARVEIVRALHPRMRVIRRRAKSKVIIAAFGFIFVFSGLYFIQSGFAKVTQWWLLGPEVFLGYAVTMIGVVLLTSLVLVPFSRALTFVFKPFIGGLATIIPRNIVLNARRSVFTYGTLALSIAFIVTIGSLVTTVASYELDVTRYVFGADIQVSVSAPLTFVQDIKSIEGVSNAAGVAYIWYHQSNVTFDGRYLSGGGVRMIGVNSTDYFETIYKFQLVETLDGMAPSQVYSALVNQSGNIIIQDALAQNLTISIGDTLTWIYRNETHTLQKDFRVIGITDMVAGAWETIYRSYKDQGFYVAIVGFEDIMEYRFSGEAGTPNYDQFYVSLTPNANVTRVTEELNQKCRAYGYHPWIGTAADVTKRVQSAYNQIQTLVLAIIIFATVISALGVMATMAYAVLERKREIGILSALGVDKRQNTAIIIGETTMLALLGLLIGLTGGLALSYFIVQIIPWWSTIPPPSFAFSWGTIALSLTVTITAVLVSSAYPAYYAAKMAVTDALRR